MAAMLSHVNEKPHLLHCTFIGGSLAWSANCPEEGIDYRARKCSVGDHGCVVQALLRDGLQPSEIWESYEEIEDPHFPLAISVHGPHDWGEAALSLWKPPLNERQYAART